MSEYTCFLFDFIHNRTILLLCDNYNNHLELIIVVFIWPWSSKGVAYANFISDLLSVVFAEYTELIRLFEMECLI